MPNCHKTTSKNTKWSLKMSKFSIHRLSEMNQNGLFWFENILSGNPALFYNLRCRRRRHDPSNAEKIGCKIIVHSMINKVLKNWPTQLLRQLRTLSTAKCEQSLTDHYVYLNNRRRVAHFSANNSVSN
jgi:hypothetical protein